MYLCPLSTIIPLYFFLHHPIFSVSGKSPTLYYPLDDIAVNCGSSGNSIALNGRQWIGDIGSKYITSSDEFKGKVSSSKVQRDQSFITDPIPYTTARISLTQFTYTFRVTSGQKFIRLHFYPISHRRFKRSKDFFTVKAGPYTLLSNFSVSLTADALGLQSVVKEFCVNVEENQLLIITFSPSRGGSLDHEVYAFVNGIEVVSLPTGLYHTRENELGAHVVGKKFRFSIEKSTALEMFQRLNVGGSFISSKEDTGMFREWSGDSSYLLESSVLPATTTIRIKHRDIKAYDAPQKVYQTSWLVLVPEEKRPANKTLNFTWKLPVDLGFRYLVRFHFCELEYEIEEGRNTEFSIFMNEEVAEAKADVINWSGGSGIAVHRDYVVMMEGDRTEGKRDLLISLCPHKNQNHEWPEQIDAILKGLEVFKLSNPDKNLAGMNPVPPLAHASPSINPNPQRFVFASRGNAIATGVVIVLTLLNVIVYQLRILGEDDRGEKNLSSSPRSEGLCRRFSLAEILSATNNFDNELVIGRGGFGEVYKAFIDGGAIAVAMKRLNSRSMQGAAEFWTEIDMLSNLRHAHLVSLIGYCDEGHEMILVYEYMENGTLADHLYKINGSDNNGTICHDLSWEQRLNICIGAARGLDYLHTGTRHGIIHRDVKTTNILLDKDWVAKIADFGLCKMGTASHSRTYVSTNVKGTFGYLDPEYFLTRRLTKKSDVFALGVVMLEVLCGRPAVNTRLVEEAQYSLVLWAQQCIKENKIDEIIDPSLKEQISTQSLKVFIEVVNKCIHNRPNGRPTMSDVVVSLECALGLKDQCRDSSTVEDEKEEEEEEEEEDASISQVVDEQIEWSSEQHNALPQDTAPSTSNPVQLNENAQGQKRSKGNLFQRSIAFLAKVMDTRSSMSNLNSNSGFASGMASRGKWNKISILAFEIANTIAKGANLVQSLSEENAQILKNEILHSEGVQQLVSTDMKELLRIAATDKREEFHIFLREVIRFGNQCKDPQWHNLYRLFSKLETDNRVPKQQREDAEMIMQELTTLAQHTSELYHELNSLDRFEQDYRRKIEEVESLNLPRKGESVIMLQSELKVQRKLVLGLKKKSLWAKRLEEVVEKLVDIVTFIHQEILEAFGDNGLILASKESVNKPERLGVAGLALHYANMINQIDNIVSRPTSLPPNMRDQLYHGLPNSVKIALRSRCQPVDVKKELTIPQIKAEMEKTFLWLVPMATNTSKVHQGFGWVGEWANTGNEFSTKGATQNNVIRLQTLYHADKQKTDLHILELATLLHRLIGVVRNTENGIRALPVRSPTHKGQSQMNLLSSRNDSSKTHGVRLSPEDRILLEKVMSRKGLVPGINQSQEFTLAKKSRSNVWALSRSTGTSPRRQLERRKSSVLDVMDGLDIAF